MDQIICSVYYPHEQLSTLVKHCILNLNDRLFRSKQISAFNYFLSMYKGESIVFFWHPVRLENLKMLQKSIENEVNEFLNKFGSTYTEQTLPVNHFFIKMRPNTLYFWDSDPYVERRIFASNKFREDQFITKLSKLCLKELSEKSDLDPEVIFMIFCQLLLTFQYVSEKYNSGKSRDFLEKLLNKIKEMQYDWIDQIHEIQNKAKMRYTEYQEYFIGLFSKIVSMVETGGNDFDNAFRIQKWTSIFNEAFSINAKNPGHSFEDFMVNFFLILTQKISQHFDKLITAVVMIHEYQNTSTERNRKI